MVDDQDSSVAHGTILSRKRPPKRPRVGGSSLRKWAALTSGFAKTRTRGEVARGDRQGPDGRLGRGPAAGAGPGPGPAGSGAGVGVVVGIDQRSWSRGCRSGSWSGSDVRGGPGRSGGRRRDRAGGWRSCGGECGGWRSGRARRGVAVPLKDARRSGMSTGVPRRLRNSAGSPGTRGARAARERPTQSRATGPTGQSRSRFRLPRTRIRPDSASTSSTLIPTNSPTRRPPP